MMNRPTPRISVQLRKRQLVFAAILIIVVSGFILRLSVNRAHAQAGIGGFTVNSIADTTDAQGCDASNCTLREAIIAANTAGGPEKIQFAQDLTGTISLKTALPPITADVRLIGPGAGVLTIRNSGSIFTRILAVAANAKVLISGLTISHGGPSPDSFGAGGTGIYNKGTLSVSSCVLANNGGSASGGGIRNDGTLGVSDTTFDTNGNGSKGGGIWNFGTATITNCTFTKGAVAEGGGIYNESGGNLTISGSNITGNDETGDGAGIYNAGHAVISQTTIAAHAGFSASSRLGGGIYNTATATLELVGSTVSANGGGEGGGIYNLGTLTAVNSTISSNQGRGIFNTGTLRLTNATIIANTSKTDGAGIFTSTPADIHNSIIAGNTAKGASDIAGAIHSLGYNLIGNTQGANGFSATDLLNVNPLLGPLGDNGGSTKTHALMAGSPAIDQATCSAAPAFDQRGVFRFDFPGVTNADGGCDIGAFEAQPIPTVSVNSATITENDAGTTDMIFTVGLDRPAASPVTVSYATEDFTASAGADYTATAGQLTIQPGNTAGTFKVPVVGDTLNEFSELFFVRLSSPQGGTLDQSVGVGLILDNDPVPALSISDVEVAEGDSGATPAVFNVNLSAASGKIVTVDYSVSPETASAGSDYIPVSGTLVFQPGMTGQTISVSVLGDAVAEPTETFTIKLSNPTNATLSRAQGTGSIAGEDSPALQLSAPTYTVSEDDLHAVITVNRTGDTSATATVDYATSDRAALTPCAVYDGNASARCDYATSVGTLRFAPGESSRSISIPIVNDSYAEGAETFDLKLSNPGGAVLGSPAKATITIIDNDTTSGPSPITDNAFFIRQLYIDILGREPEPEAVDNWLKILNRCQPASDCDRIAVAMGFINSREFQERGYFVYRFYSAAFGRPPHYDEFMPDIARVSGFLSNSELEANRQAFIGEFMQRQEFSQKYASVTDPRDFVTLLEKTSGVSLSNRETLVADLAAGKMTRADVLRAVALSPEINARYANEAFVVMNYFGFLRRDPDSLYQNWISILNQTNDTRAIVSGFLNSLELRQRFGQ